MTQSLLLFDVDGTLIERGDPTHVGALNAAARQVFPRVAERNVSIEDLDFDGRVDRNIVRMLLEAAGEPEVPSAGELDSVFRIATEMYTETWRDQSGQDDLLSGVVPLLEELANRPDDFALAVMTGGASGIVRTKLRRLGLEHYFPVGAFGDEVDQRSELVPIAIKRATSWYGQQLSSECVLVIGDTPHDIACAHDHSIPCLAVATGKYSVDELSNAGADGVQPSLSSTQDTIDHILMLSCVSSCDC